MAAPWRNYPGLSAPVCVVCCEAGVDCRCALLVPFGDISIGSPLSSSEFASLAAAQAALATNIIPQFSTHPTYATAPCILFVQTISGFDFDGSTVTSTASEDVGISVTAVMDATNIFGGPRFPLVDHLLSLNLKGGSTLSIEFTTSSAIFPQAIPIGLYRCDGSVVSQSAFQPETGETTGVVTMPIDEDGEYIVVIKYNDQVTMPFTSTVIFTSDEAIFANPVIAIWDDSGTPTELECCPRLLLPYTTEITGDWFTDEAAAQDEMDIRVASCLGYFVVDDGPAIAEIGSNGPVPDSFSVTGGTGTMNLTAAATNLSSDYFDPPRAETLCCLNLVAGDTLTISYSFSNTGGFGASDAEVFLHAAEDWELLWSDSEEIDFSDPTGTFTHTVPYTGKFYLRLSGMGYTNGPISAVAQITASFDVTSDGLVAHPVQALYDLGLDCPARLDCE